MADQKKVRLSLELTAENDKRLSEMAEQLGGTKSDILRRALALIDVAFEAKAKGHRMAVTDADSHVLREIVVN